MASFRGLNTHDQKVEHYLILRVPQGDKSVMNLSSVNRENRQPELPGLCHGTTKRVNYD